MFVKIAIMKWQFFTLGCRLNKAEIQKWRSEIEAKGLGSNTDKEVIVVNSCSVTAKADKESRQLLRRLRRENPKACLIATGCWATSKLKVEGGKLKDDSFGVDLLIDNSQKEKLVERVVEELRNDELHRRMRQRTILGKMPRTVLHRNKSGRYFVKIQDGCNKFCSFCIVPFLRGRSRSFPAPKVLAYIKSLEKRRAQEIILSGVDIAQYQDEKKINLAGLLKILLAQTQIPRFSLGSIYPEGITGEFLQVYKNNWPRLCRHFHLALQSGCNATLERMNRHYGVEKFSATVKEIRKAIPDVNITSDVIVGFPGETETEFQESLKNIRAMQFGKIHVFPFSARLGTAAAIKETQWGRLTKAEKAERAKIMGQLSNRMRQKFRQRFLGRHLEVLWEKKNSAGLWEGFSDNFLRVYSSQSRQPGTITQVKVDKTGANRLSV